jgi:hypothetical protein
MIITIVLTAVGSIFSEKTQINGICLLLAFCTGMGTIFTWLKLSTAFEDAANVLGDDDDFDEFDPLFRVSSYDALVGNLKTTSNFKSGLGFNFLCSGVGLAFVAGVMSLCDRCICVDEDRQEQLDKKGSACTCDDDGIGYTGRFGSVLTVATWVCLLASLATNSWVQTSALGRAGCFCSNEAITNTSTGCVGTATFGLYEYCLEPLIPEYGNKPYPVCFPYKEVIATPAPDEGYGLLTNCTGSVKNGIERFEEWHFLAKRGIVGWGIMGSIACVMLADVYSEKLLLCCILNLVAFGLGLFCLIIWISFFEGMALDTDALLIFGLSGYMLVIGWMGALFCAMLYGHDFLCNMQFLMVVKKDGKTARIYVDSSDETGSDESDSDGSDSDNGGRKKKKKKKGKKSKKKETSFDDLDSDGDGKLSKSEMKKAGLSSSQRDELDRDGNGKVTEKEFNKANLDLDV